MARPRKSLDTTEMEVGQQRVREMSSMDEEFDHGDTLIEVVAEPLAKKKADMEAFMAEPIEIMVHESTDPNVKGPFIETWVNGRMQLFQRGVPQVVKRMYVGVLARAKHTAYRQEEYTDAQGNRAIRNIPSTVLKYPFSVISDPNPKGAEWLRNLLAEH